MKATSRTDDPSTSHEAARNVERTGTAQSHREKILALVRAFPGSTCDELAADLHTLNRYQVSKRLPELLDATPPYIEAREPRTCRIAGTRQLTWWPATQGDLF